MTCQPVSSVGQTLPHNFAGRDFCPAFPLSCEVDLVIAPITSPKPTPSLPALLDYQLTEALSLRAAMIRDRQSAINRRDMQAVNEIEADLRDVVMVAMMGRVR